MERAARRRLLVLWAVLALFAAVGGAVAAVRAPSPSPSPSPPPSAAVAAATATATPATPSAPARPAKAGSAERRPGRARPRLPAGWDVRSVLERAQGRGRIARSSFRRWRRDLTRARAALRVLSGSRRAELAAAVGVVDRLAAAKRLTVSRMPLAFLTLRRNTTVWRTRPFPAPAERMTFGRDPAVFQYFPGRGVQFHALGTAGRANALAAACLREHRRRDRLAARRPAAAGSSASGADHGAGPAHDEGPTAARGHEGACRPRAARRRLDRLAALSSQRGRFRAWESLYDYGGGTAPWVSGMTQATAAQALARGAVAFGERRYAAAAVEALGAFDVPAPVGVRSGEEFLMYSFAPGLHVLNGAVQMAVGLHDVAELTGSPQARRLSLLGERTVRRTLPGYDTGAWSLYSAGGREATLGYHELVTGFLGDLCARTGRRDYCDRAARFARYERRPPRIGLRVGPLQEARQATLALTLSKVSTTRVVVRDRAGTVLERAGTLPYGRYAYAFTPPRPGAYRVAVSATGPEGRTATVTRVLRAKPDPVRIARERAARRRAAAQRRQEARRRAAAKRRRERAEAREEATARFEPGPSTEG